MASPPQTPPSSPSSPPPSSSSQPNSSSTGTNTALHSSQPPSPEPLPAPGIHRSSSAKDILKEMRDLPELLSPLHASHIQLSLKSVDEFLDSVTVNPSLSSSPPSLSQPPPLQPILGSTSAEEILSEMRDLTNPLSPLHTSHLQLPLKGVDAFLESETVNPSLSSSPPSQSATDLNLDMKPHWSAEDERLLSQGIRECGPNCEVLATHYVKTKTPNQIMEHLDSKSK